jgi:hypothetical protein
MFARIRHPLKLEAERINGTVYRFAPRDDLSRPGLGAWRIHQLRIFIRLARRAGQGLGPGFDFAGDLGAPVGAIWRDVKSDPCAFDASDLPTFRKQRSDDGGKSTDLAAKDARRTSAWRSSARSSMKMPAVPLAFPAQRSPSHLPTRTKLRSSRLISP